MGWVETAAAVRDLLAPLVADGTLAIVTDGPQNTVTANATAEVRFTASSVGRNPEAGILERRHVRNGVVRLYVKQRGALGVENARFMPLIDAVEAAFRDNPELPGIADRFDATGNGPMLRDAEVDCLFVDVGWQATEIEPETFEQDW